MIELAPRSASPIARFGGQPIAIAAAALVIVVVGVTSITLWRVYTGSAPETERVVATRQLQARAAQASEQLDEKTKGLEATQQADTRKLSEQVGTLTEAIDGLRQSFASAQASEPSAAPAPRNRSAKARPRSNRTANRSRAKARG